MGLSIHPKAFISPFAEIEESARGSSVVVGAESYIDSFVKVKAAGGLGNITIGSHTYINSGCVLYFGNGITIGDRVSIAANCVLAPTNHEYRDRTRPHQSQGFAKSRGGIEIDDDVWIGAGSVILDGSIIPRGVIVGALSLVRERLEPYGIYVGNPLRKLGRRGD